VLAVGELAVVVGLADLQAPGAVADAGEQDDEDAGDADDAHAHPRAHPRRPPHGVHSAGSGGSPAPSPPPAAPPPAAPPPAAPPPAAPPPEASATAPPPTTRICSGAGRLSPRRWASRSIRSGWVSTEVSSRSRRRSSCNRRSSAVAALS